MAQTSVTPGRGGFLQRDLETPFHSLHREMNRLFDDIFHGWARSAAQESSAPLMPTMDISETADQVRVRIELPGVSESDIDVSLDGEVLSDPMAHSSARFSFPLRSLPIRFVRSSTTVC
jgi:HSP20 family protein